MQRVVGIPSVYGGEDVKEDEANISTARRMQ